MPSPADVTAVLVTRGDVDMTPILDSLIFPTAVIWNNSEADDLKAFGRYAAMHYVVKTEYVYTQDDDCIVSAGAQLALLNLCQPGEIVSNMPADHGLGHSHLKLLGWGSVFETRLPFAAFDRWIKAGHETGSDEWLIDGCDIVFPVLTPGVRYDLGHEERSFSHDANRTHNQPGYSERKQAYYEAACELLHSAAE